MFEDIFGVEDVGESGQCIGGGFDGKRDFHQPIRSNLISLHRQRSILELPLEHLSEMKKTQMEKTQKQSLRYTSTAITNMNSDQPYNMP